MCIGAAGEERKWRAFGMAPETAAALGTGPLAPTAPTRVRGIGVLADTPATGPPFPVIQ